MEEEEIEKAEEKEIEKDEEKEEEEIIIKEETEKKTKPEINISIDNKENQTTEKIIPEINISIDNKEANISNEKSQNKSDNNNNSNNNIINNSINININNSDNSNKNDINEQKQYIQLNDIKYNNNLKPGYFIRKVVREEHYYIDENGKEKILQVKQEYINNEDTKKMKTKNPHRKKYVNIGKKIKNNNYDLNKLNQTEPIGESKNEDKVKNKENIEDKDYLMNLSIRKEKRDIDSYSIQLEENKGEKIVENKKEINDNLINDNLSSASEPIMYPKYGNYSYFKLLENYSKINKKKESQYIFKKLEKEKENNIIDISNLQTAPNIQKKEYPSISINLSKNLETKTTKIQPQNKKEYISNTQLTSSYSNRTTKINNNDSNKKEKINNTMQNINLKPVTKLTHNYIKVNKMDKYKNPNIESYKNLSLNTYSLYNNANIKTSRKRRESSKNHTYHEINLTTNKNNENKLSNNSLSKYFNEGNDELNTSSNTNKISVNQNNDRNYIHKYNIHTHSIYDINNIKTNNNSYNIETRATNRFHRNKNKNELNKSVNKEHHRYYESKSIKKDRNNSKNNKVFSQYTFSSNIDSDNKKELRSKKIDNINKTDKGYYYSQYDINNNNNSLTAKKNNKTTIYYH